MLFGLGLHTVCADRRVTPSSHHVYHDGASRPNSGPGCGLDEFLDLDRYTGGEGGLLGTHL